MATECVFRVLVKMATAFCVCGGLSAHDGPPAPQASFEVASVKANRSGASESGSKAQGERFTAVNVSLKLLIQMAYNVGPDRLIGGPSWIAADRFDVIGKAERPFVPPNQWQAMLKTLLVDRFGLVVHSDVRDTPVYALVLGSETGTLGAGLRVATTDCRTLRAQAVQSAERDPCGLLTVANAMGTGRMRARGLGIDALAGAVGRDAGRAVVNRTGLMGEFDWELTWTPQAFLQRSFDRERFQSIDPDGPSIFTAVQEQLGLRLVSDKGSADVVVIDSVQHPTDD